MTSVYTPADVAAIDYPRDLGEPGQFPYTRGIHPSGYRGKLWTMRQFAGFGTAADTNQRYRELLAAGGTGLSVAFDLPTLMGRDPDNPLSLGEVGKCGVSVVTLADMEALFEGIDLGAVTTSMTINSPASMLFAMYLVVAERQGVPWSRASRARSRTTSSRSTSPRGVHLSAAPVDAADRRYLPLLRRARVRAGTPSRSAGTTSAKRGDGGAGSWRSPCATASSTSQWGVDAGLDVDTFVPRLSFFFNAHNDFFEEIAKYRAARRIWARVMRGALRRPIRDAPGSCASIPRPPASR